MPPAFFLSFTTVSYTHLDVYKRQIFIPFITQELFQTGAALYYGLNALSNNMIPVSYTHLDVYKRQPIAGGNQRKDHSPLHQDRKADRAAAPKGYELSLIHILLRQRIRLCRLLLFRQQQVQLLR